MQLLFQWLLRWEWIETSSTPSCLPANPVRWSMETSGYQRAATWSFSIHRQINVTKVCNLTLNKEGKSAPSQNNVKGFYSTGNKIHIMLMGRRKEINLHSGKLCLFLDTSGKNHHHPQDQSSPPTPPRSQLLRPICRVLSRREIHWLLEDDLRLWD